MRDLLDALHRNASSAGGGEAFRDHRGAVSWRDLAARVRALAAELQGLCPPRMAIGLLGANSVDWVVGQLAGWHAGLTVVPLPPFFPQPYLQAILRDADVRQVLATDDGLAAARDLGLPVVAISRHRHAPLADAEPPAEGGGQIVYTSGSTGTPKGVLLQSGQIPHTAAALVTAIQARPSDRYLSAMPLALLLETICAIAMPILVGAPVRLQPDLAAGFTTADGRLLAQTVAEARPTCLTLTPHLLAAWVTALTAGAATVPDSLRFVAVGGAATPPRLVDRAWTLGIPAHQGYGLTECGSVVALNRPGEGRGHSVGRPLSDLSVTIRQGEIVVAGPSVMDGYVGQAPANGVWRTGDLGAFDADGRLTVHGRADNLIVTPAGRNVSPEWIEALVASDPRIALCLVAHVGGPHLAAAITPSATGAAWFAAASQDETADLVRDLCVGVPDHAVPRTVAVLSQADLAAAGALTGNGRVRRQAARTMLQAALPSLAASEHV
ncbi:MAG: AMP-binding protein [Alphaproteobacteria bacterium]|nr:AMP-binding protein [Alphaproteobacteria bacterium]MCB9930308.1 AMP-binding protein [Alphaproteobacteria bacterium]